MAIFRSDNYVPDVYIEESRDFQLFLKVLDFTQNAIKYDIDSILSILATEDIPTEYLERLKSKIGFFSSKKFNDEELRIALKIFPFIIKYKGSLKGVEMCVNAFLNLIGNRKGSNIQILNNDPISPYTIRIGVNSPITNLALMEELLSFIVPIGYFIEIYFYTDLESKSTSSIFTADSIKVIDTNEKDNASLLKSYTGERNEEKESHYTIGSVQMGRIYDPNPNMEEKEN